MLINKLTEYEKQKAQIDELNKKLEDIQYQLAKNAGEDDVDHSVSSIAMTIQKQGSESNLDLGFLYASPLVMMTDSNVPISIEHLDCQGEYKKIISYMAATKKAIKHKKWLATTGNLTICLEQKPLFLHFSGHGMPGTIKAGNPGYVKPEFFLIFENGAGEALKLSKEELKHYFFGNYIPDLVFVSACHSQLIATTFSNLGVNHVISVKFDHSIADKIATEFAENFYMFLFSERNTVCNAFEKSKSIVYVKHKNDPTLADEVNNFIIKKKVDELGKHYCTPFPVSLDVGNPCDCNQFNPNF